MPHVLSNTTSMRRRLLTLLLSLVVALGCAATLASPADAAVPGPVSPSASPLDRGATVSFVPNGGDDPAISGYEVSATTNPSLRNWQPFNPVYDGFFQSSGDIGGLQNGVTYYVYVRARNADGNAPDGSVAEVVPGRPLAPFPTAVPDDSSASITIQPPSVDGGLPITGYEVSVTTSVAARVWRTAQGIDASGQGVTVVNGLANGTTYYVAARARNSEGAGQSSDAQYSTVTPGVPLAPQPNAAPGDQSLVITFPLPAGGGFPVTRLDVSVSQDPDARVWRDANCFPSTPDCVVDSDGNVTLNVSNLSNGATYYVSVRARNSRSTGPEGQTSGVPDATPAAPTGVYAEPSVSNAPSVEGNASAKVFFTPPPGGGGANPTLSSFTATSTPGGFTTSCSESPCEIYNLTNGVAYTFTVSATNNAGAVGAESDASAAVTPRGAPFATTGLQRAAANPASLTVSFVSPANGGTPITAYEFSLDRGKTWRVVGTRPAGSKRLATVSGLRGSTRYVVAIRARNALGPGTPASNLTILTGPGTVARPSARAGTSAALVRWPANAGRDVVGYTVASTSGARCYTYTRTETSCIIGNTAGVRTYYRVYARNATGSSFASSATNIVRAAWPSVPSRLPGVPGGFRAVPKKVKSGKNASLTARGFLPSSSIVLVAYGKTRHVVKRFTANAAGNFVVTVKMPKDSARSLTFVAFGVTPYASSKAIAASIRRG